MVKICNSEYRGEDQYGVLFERYVYPLSDFQKYAIQAIEEDAHILLAAHTGSGKTLPAEYAIEKFVKEGKKGYLYGTNKGLIK